MDRKTAVDLEVAACLRDVEKIMRASIFYPVDRECHESGEAMHLAHSRVQQSALSSYPGADGDLVVALSMLALQLQSVIDGAKARKKSQIDAICGQIRQLDPDDITRKAFYNAL